MKDMAIVKLTKGLVSKVGDKVAQKRKKWAEEGAKSVEETRRREAEFKEDFTSIKKVVDEGASKAKEEVQKGVEATVKAKENIQAKVEDKKLGKKAEEEPEVKDEEAKTVEKTVEKKEASEEKVAKKASTKKAPSSKKAEKIALYTADIQKHYGTVDGAFLEIVVKNLGPSIYKKDAELVSCSDKKELDTVRKNFLVKKLELQESDDVLNGYIQEVCEELKNTRNKYRATFYYALAKKLKMESKLS